ncbi:hypothetical protein OROMI_018383 [Orobanche minor]
MEGGSRVSPPTNVMAASSGRASKFLTNLPSRDFFSSTVISSNPMWLLRLGKLRDHLGLLSLSIRLRQLPFEHIAEVNIAQLNEGISVKEYSNEECSSLDFAS